jgi:membrane-associated phospholipid phosphatase
MALFIALDVIPRAFHRAGWPPRGAASMMRSVFRERWSLRRLLIVVGALLGFYLTYVGYRNLKSFLPFAREANYDNFLLDLDRTMGFGHNPGVVLHDLLGTGFTAQILSLVYVTFLIFVPISLGVAVVWQRRLHSGIWYVTSMNIGWLLGAASYYLLPALGPAYAAPQYFMTLPATGVSKLQESLLVHRFDVISSPYATDGVQSIAAFASLHVALVLNAALIAHLLQVRRSLRVGLWVFLALTMLATVYFGWHYIIDLIAGAGIGVIAVVLGAALSGHALRPASRVRVLAGGAHSTASAT